MVRQDLHDSITEAVGRVLEMMCFSAVLGTCDSHKAQSLLALSAAVDYSGASRGTLLVGCNQAGAQALAENFLGDDQVSGEQVPQFICELANMICGAVVSGFESDGQFVLETPRLVRPDSFLALNGLRCDFEIDGGILSVIAGEA
jgi:CheY-specific phosphatase CheX